MLSKKIRMITVTKRGRSDGFVVQNAKQAREVFPGFDVEIKYMERHPTMPHRGCAESHAEMLRQVFAEDEEEYSLILEEDATWDKNKFDLKNLQDFLRKEKPDVVFLGSSPLPGGPLMTAAVGNIFGGENKTFEPGNVEYVSPIQNFKPVQEGSLKFYKSAPLALVAYVVNKKAARNFYEWVISRNPSKNIAIDAYTSMECKNNLRCYSLHPMAVFQDNPKYSPLRNMPFQEGLRMIEGAYMISEPKDSVLFYVIVSVLVIIFILIVIAGVFSLRE